MLRIVLKCFYCFLTPNLRGFFGSFGIFGWKMLEVFCYFGSVEAFGIWLVWFQVFFYDQVDGTMPTP